jgi:hypothetical protein
MDDQGLQQKIVDIFGTNYKDEAEIVYRTIECHKNIIILCGSSPIGFAEYCKNKINKHYQTKPNEKFTKIIFKQMSLGFDEWEIKPLFKYEAVEQKDGKNESL